MCGNVDVVEDLIKVGGKQVIQQADKRNLTALLHAISCGHQVCSHIGQDLSFKVLLIYTRM